MGERGQVVPLLAVVVLAAGGLLVGLVRMGAVAVDVGRAQAAADATALAGAAEGRAAAEAVAAANGAEVLDYVVEGREVEVTVAVGRGRASARAARLGRRFTEGEGTTDRGSTPSCWSPLGSCDAPAPYTPSRGAGRRERSRRRRRAHHD